VLKLFVRTLGVIVALAVSGSVCAVGMGAISITTGLGEPLRAEIKLVAASKADNRLSASLASPEAFKTSGIDYPSALPKLKFQVVSRTGGEPYISVTSELPVNEPIVNLLVQLDWSSGKLLREYIFLLDPPGFNAQQPAATEVQPLAPVVTRVGDAKPAVSKNQPMLVHAPMDEKANATKQTTAAVKTKASATKKQAAAKKVASAPQPVARAKPASGKVTVRRGDTLSKIARESRPAGVSLERMLVALYRVNENVFDDKNMNRIQAGRILRIPNKNELESVAQKEAVKEIHMQTADWQAYRQRLAAATGSAVERVSRHEVSGKIRTSVADKTPAAKKSAKEIVRLSKGEAPGNKSVSNNIVALKNKLHSIEEEVISKDKELDNRKERIAMLEKNIAVMQRLIKLKTAALPSAEVKPEVKPIQNKVEEPKSVKPAEIPVVASAVLPPVSAVVAAKPVVKHLPKVAPPPPATSWLDEFLAEPLYLAGAALALLGLVGLILVRRRRASEEYIEEDESTVAYITEPVAPSPDTGDFTHTTTSPLSATEDLSDVDPISEAELFLNFGRDVQAEDILKDALTKNPGNQLVRLKLLSIYENRKDTNTFAVVAQQVQDSGDAAAWAQAAEMGRKLEPGNPMYGGDGEDVAVTEGTPIAETESEQTASSLDFDLGAESPAAEVDVIAVGETTSSGLDFDLDLDSPIEPAIEAEASDVPLATEKDDVSSAMDFDIGFKIPTEDEPVARVEENYISTVVIEPPKEKEALELALDIEETSSAPVELDFDVSKSLASPAKVEELKIAPAEEAEDGVEKAMTFSLDIPGMEELDVEDSPPVQDEPKEAPAIDLSFINLNVGESETSLEEEPKNSHWHDVATKLDLAKAYQEMGDASGAREILEEVLAEGDDKQRDTANEMLYQINT